LQYPLPQDLVKLQRFDDEIILEVRQLILGFWLFGVFSDL
jgi:hypothetical protein